MLRYPHPTRPHFFLLPFQIPRECVQHEQHLRVRGGHVGLHQLSMPDQSGAESGLPGNLRPRRALQARPVRGAEDAVARAVVRGTLTSFVQISASSLERNCIHKAFVKVKGAVECFAFA